jgi:hypothetical protein
VPPQPSYCAVDHCRFSLGYASDVRLGPLGRAPRLPVLQVFASEAASGYEHYHKHLALPSGRDVLELLRLAWKSARHVVLPGRERAIVWIVEHDVLDRYLLTGSRVKLIAKTCSAYTGNAHCCTGCARDRPQAMTLRSVQSWSQVVNRAPSLHSDVAQDDLDEYLSDQPDSWIGRQFAIAGVGGFRNPWRKEFHYLVPVQIEASIVDVRVVAEMPHSDAIDADEAAFARSHDVIFTGRLPNRTLAARFIRRV